MNWILWRQAYKIFVLGAAALLFAVAAWGQGSTGTITGTVTDPSGGVVAGATVTATNTGTGTEKKTVTDNSGSYSFVDLPPGMYTITSEAVGFRKTTLSAQRLIVASNLRLDVALEVGAVTESVTVDAASPQVNAEDAQLAPQWDHLKSTANAPKRTISFWMAPMPTIWRSTFPMRWMSSRPTPWASFAL